MSESLKLSHGLLSSRPATFFDRVVRLNFGLCRGSGIIGATAFRGLTEYAGAGGLICS
jgi:hypothetical protein